MNGGFTDPESMSDDPPLAQQPGILFSTLVRDMTRFAKRYSLCLPNWQRVVPAHIRLCSELDRKQKLYILEYNPI